MFKKLISAPFFATVLACNPPKEAACIAQIYDTTLDNKDFCQCVMTGM